MRLIHECITCMYLILRIHITNSSRFTTWITKIFTNLTTTGDSYAMRASLLAYLVACRLLLHLEGTTCTTVQSGWLAVFPLQYLSIALINWSHRKINVASWRYCRSSNQLLVHASYIQYINWRNSQSSGLLTYISLLERDLIRILIHIYIIINIHAEHIKPKKFRNHVLSLASNSSEFLHTYLINRPEMIEYFH
jgi:hypothetical protein